MPIVIICRDLIANRKTNEPAGYAAYARGRDVDLAEFRYHGWSPDEAIGCLVREYLNSQSPLTITEIVRLNWAGEPV